MNVEFSDRAGVQLQASIGNFIFIFFIFRKDMQEPWQPHIMRDSVTLAARPGLLYLKPEDEKMVLNTQEKLASLTDNEQYITGINHLLLFKPKRSVLKKTHTSTVQWSLVVCRRDQMILSLLGWLAQLLPASSALHSAWPGVTEVLHHHPQRSWSPLGIPRRSWVTLRKLSL